MPSERSACLVGRYAGQERCYTDKRYNHIRWLETPQHLHFSLPNKYGHISEDTPIFDTSTLMGLIQQHCINILHAPDESLNFDLDSSRQK